MNMPATPESGTALQCDVPILPSARAAGERRGVDKGDPEASAL